MKGILSTTDLDDASLVAKAQASPGLVGRDLAREVMPRESTSWELGLDRSFRCSAPPANTRPAASRLPTSFSRSAGRTSSPSISG